jgi:two-component system nitrogen regulation response regulator NtrX
METGLLISAVLELILLVVLLGLPFGIYFFRVRTGHTSARDPRRQPDRPLDRFGSLQEVREAAEREYILKKLEETNGNVTRTAELLGLERSNLYRKMRTLGIGPKE